MPERHHNSITKSKTYSQNNLQPNYAKTGSQVSFQLRIVGFAFPLLMVAYLSIVAFDLY
jgi:hypothetical protein